MWPIFLILSLTNFVSGVIVDDYPYKINIYNEASHICSGIIITEYEIVTLAQCVHDWKKQKLSVRALGSDSRPKFYEVAAVEIHPAYTNNPGRRLNDIAVVRILEPILGEQHYANLFENDTSRLVGARGNIIGFDYRRNSSFWDTQQASLVVKDKDTCDGFILGGIAAGQFCGTIRFLSSLRVQPEICSEDKGIFFETSNHRAVGLASDWEGECSTKIVFTDLAYFKNFIKKAQEYFNAKTNRGEFQIPKGFDIESNRIAQCNIYRRQDHQCSGIVYTRHEIIAPAQCVQGWKTDGLEVRVQTPQKDIRYYGILDVDIHNGYEFRNGEPINDIAVIRVAGSLERPKYYTEFLGEVEAVQKGALGAVVNFDYSLANGFIWGRKESGVTIEDQSACGQHLRSQLAANQFCARISNFTQNSLGQGRKARLCSGDNGASFVIDNKIIGMASYWNKTGRYGCSKVAVYTNIASHRDFIDQSLQRFEQKANRGMLKNPPGTGNYVVSLERNGTDFICAGVLISDREVITSAGCARRNEPGDWRLTMIRAGSESPSQGGQLRTEIRRCYCDEHHWNLNTRRRNYDIAVMRVDKPFDFSKDVSAIDLYGKKDVVFAGDTGVLSYFPKGSTLVKEKVQLEGTETCKKAYSSSPYGTIADDHICASPSEFCENDNGGLLVIRERLAGVATFGVDSCDPQRNPDVFTNIAKVRSDIDGCLDWFKQLEREGKLNQYGDYRNPIEKIIEKIAESI